MKGQNGVEKNGHHYRNLSNNNEIDIIIENENGEYGAFEVKLGSNKIDEAADSLIRFRDSFEKVEDQPKILVIVCGICDISYTRNDGVMVVPITSLRP